MSLDLLLAAVFEVDLPWTRSPVEQIDDVVETWSQQIARREARQTPSFLDAIVEFVQVSYRELRFAFLFYCQ